MIEEALGEASCGTATVVLGSDMMMGEENRAYKAVLFADVSGSARLHEKLGETEALRAVERCMKRMERAVEAFEGRILIQSGDELKAAFAAADEASMAAIEMQQRVADLPPISGVKLAIRAGFSYGMDEGDTASPSELDNTAARLAGLAKPGQILISVQAHNALSPVLQLSTRDRGALPAKGSVPATQVFELIALDSSLLPIESSVSSAVAKSNVPQGSRLRLRYGEELIVLDKRNPVITMGRDTDCDIVIHDRRASRNHVDIEWREGNRFVLLDKSTNGTFVTLNGQPEIHLHREQCVIYGQGVICFAASASTPEADKVEFEQF